MKTEIEKRFKQNLDRVRSLVSVYAGLGAGAGRRDVETSDVLRAAVVFLHATVEDLIRSILDWKLPTALPQHIEDIPLVGTKPRTKYDLGELARHRGKTVDSLIADSVMVALQGSNFNNPGEIEQALERVGLPKTLLDPYRPKLGPMMQRRHWIVHRADRNTASGSGHHAARSLQRSDVETWLDALEQFGDAVLAAI